MIARPWMIVLVSLAMIVALAWAMWRMSNPGSSAQAPEELVLFCANGLLKPVREIAANYEQEYGVKIRLEADASGPLLSKLRVAGDRADLFLSGEESFVREGQAQHLIAEILPVARQHVVVAVGPKNPRKIATVHDLLAEGVRVAIPNPQLAAAGRSAERALAGAEWDALMDQSRKFAAKVSLVGTVTDAARDVKTGAVDAAFVWDATARQFDLDIVEVPLLREQTVETATLGVVAATDDPTAALHFARYLSARDRGQPIFTAHYFTPLADADLWESRPQLVLMAGAMLKPGIDDLIKSFSSREGVLINTIYAGCGIHVAEMKALKKGQPAPHVFPDAYFACDVSFMKQVQEWFEASKIISRNDMVLVVPKGNPKKIQSLEGLAEPNLKIGLGHPTNSALGALTDDLLKKLRLHSRVYASDRKYPIVHKDAGHDLVNSMRAGALDAMVVYRSNVLSNPENAEKHIEIVEMNLPEAIAVQPYAVGRGSVHKHLMRRLLDAILAPESEIRFRNAGFQWVADSSSSPAKVAP